MAEERVDALFWWVGATVCTCGALLMWLLVIWFVVDVIIKKTVALPDLWRLCRAIAKDKKNGKVSDG